MDKFIKDLDSNLDYLEHEVKEEEVIIYVASNRSTGICPYCGTPSGRIHSYYPKCFQGLPIMDKKTTVCIDGFAFRKGQRYGTIMIDIETHKVVGVIDSRDTLKVTEWLGTFPNLEIVSRDGSASYRKAIGDAGRNILQVSDRFHLLKGLTDAAKKHILRILAANTGIPVEGSHYEGTEGCRYWKKNTEDDLPARTHSKNLECKLKKVRKAKELREERYSISKTAEELQVSYSTAKKYASKDYNPVNGNYNTKHPSKVKPYEKKSSR